MVMALKLTGTRGVSHLRQHLGRVAAQEGDEVLEPQQHVLRVWRRWSQGWGSRQLRFRV